MLPQKKITFDSFIRGVLSGVVIIAIIRGKPSIFVLLIKVQVYGTSHILSSVDRVYG